MSKSKEVKNPILVGTQIEGSVAEELVKIQHREGFNSESKLLRKIINEYVQNHADGNDTYTLDKFDDGFFTAVPAFFSAQDKWVKHYKQCNDKDKTNLRIQAINLSKWFRMVDVNE